MIQMLTISDTLYKRLETTVHLRGLRSIEELLVVWQAREDEWRSRKENIRRIETLRNRLFAQYGEMPDSVVFIREDRER